MSELPADLRKFIQDAMYEAVKDGPLVMTSDKFIEAMITVYVRGVADGQKTNTADARHDALCWVQPDDGRLVACDRARDHNGAHSWA